MRHPHPPVIESDYVTCNRLRRGYRVTFNDGSSLNTRYLQEARVLEARAAALPDALDMTPASKRPQTVAARVRA